MTFFQSLILGALQGLTELFPVSSLGHSVVLPTFFQWHIDQSSETFVTFIIATHAATALVLLGFFWRDWVRLLKGFVRSLKARTISNDDRDAKLFWLLVIATIPAGLLGLLFEDTLKGLFATPRLVAFALILNGIMLGLAERLKKRKQEVPATSGEEVDHRVAGLSFRQAIGVGVMQCLALFPGFSRTGSTITGGLLVDLTHEEAARFSFLLATPIIGAAAFLKLAELHATRVEPLPIGVGVVASSICAYLAVRFLTKYFRSNSLRPFALYCVAIGVFLTGYFSFFPPV